MKTFAALSLVLGALALPAVADGLSGYDCSNQCPLAQRANEMRSPGLEAISVAPSLRADLADEVARNLGRI